MKKRNLWLFRILSLLIAAAISYGLWSANLIPFSVFSPADETAAEAVAEETGETVSEDDPAAEAKAEPDPAAEGETESEAEDETNKSTAEALAQDATDPEPIDPKLLQIWSGGSKAIVFSGETKPEQRSIHLINLSNKPLELTLFLKGIADSSDNRAEFNATLQPTQLTLAAKSAARVDLTVNQNAAEEAPADQDFEVLVLLDESVQSLPFTVEYRLSDLQRLQQLFQENPGNGVLVAIVFGLLTAILAILLMWKIFPYLFPFTYNVLVLNTKQEGTNADLWEVFMSEFINLQQATSNPIQPMPMSDSIELPANIGSGDDRIKTILQLTNLIVPKRGHSLSIKTLESKENGKGLILNLTKNEKGQIIATRTFWAKDYRLMPEANPAGESTPETAAAAAAETEPALDLDLYRKLVIPAIMWVIQLHQMKFDPHRKTRRDEGDEVWESQALAILGRDVWTMNAALGKAYFAEALLEDPTNSNALAGMGRIWLEEAQQEDLDTEDAANRLHFGMEYLKAAEEYSDDSDSAYYAAAYNRIVGKVYQLSALKGDTSGQYAELQKKMADLIKLARAVLRKRISPKFKTYLERLIPMALIVEYSIALNAKLQPSIDEVNDLVKALYAQLDSVPIKLQNEPVDSQQEEILLTSAFGCLVNLHYRAQYNYACFFSRCFQLLKGQGYEEALLLPYAHSALNYLTLALCHGGGLRIYALDDPSLRPLHDDDQSSLGKTLKASFDKIVYPPQEKPKEPAGAPADKRLIGQLPGITPEQNTALAALSIRSMTELLMHGAEPKGRADLAQKIGIDTGHLTWWLNLCDLTRVEGLSMEDALKLESLGKVDTVRELAGRDANNLHQAMRNLISLETLQEWIECAKHLLPVLKYINSS